MTDLALDLARALEDEAAASGFPAGTGARLVALLEAVMRENDAVNLTGAKSLAVAAEVLARDSLPVGRAWPGDRVPPRVAIDLGTGNGFPGAAVALRWPACRVVLVERREKKARAVERALAAAAVGNAVVVACDGRELLARRPDLRAGADLVVVRAVGDLTPVIKEAAPWLAAKGRLVHWKSADVSAEERRAGDDAARAARLTPVPDLPFRTSDAHPPRLLVAYERRA